VTDAIRFFADQHFPGPVVQGLRHRGVDVLTAQEAGRCQLTDPEQLAFAASEGRVVLTFDSDFLALHQAGITHAGIAWCPATKYSIGDLIRVLVLLHGVLSAAEMQNHLEHL
jgi:predicted nuclease of predicted toxin-antitoxin system